MWSGVLKVKVEVLREWRGAHVGSQNTSGSTSSKKMHRCLLRRSTSYSVTEESPARSFPQEASVELR